MTRQSSGHVVLILSLCLSLVACGRHKLRPDEIERNRVFASILELEDRRALGKDGFLETNLESSPYPEVRQWCAVALGRIGDARALRSLYRAFISPRAALRAAAAFAVGEIEDRDLLQRESRHPDPRARGKLKSLLEDSALEVRARAAEALGKAGMAEDALSIKNKLEQTINDGSPQVRVYFDSAITALMRLKNPETYSLLQKLAERADPEIQWRAVNALIRVRDQTACPVFLRLLGSPNRDVQAYAALGVGICEDAGLSASLFGLLPPRDAGSGQPVPLPVRFNAVRALGMLKNRNSIPAIESALRAMPVENDYPEQVNFASAAAAALGTIGAREGEAALLYLLQTPGPAADSAVIALGRVLSSDPMRFFQLVRANQFTDPPALRAWAQALGELGGTDAVEELKAILVRSTADRATLAATLAVPTVLTALAKAKAPDLADFLKVYMTSHDGVILRTALEAYKADSHTHQPWAPIVRAYAEMAPGNDVETKVSIIDHLEPWADEPEVQSALRAALGERLRNVRIAAARLLRNAMAEGVPDFPGESETRLAGNNYEMVAGARRDRTVAILETDRGNIELDLFREDAPLTVSNFVELAKGGYFNGQSFMRVVPFFVVQSGDPRNDQEGGPGYSIRCEINLRPFERGSIGMALAGKDTGGSQFFITLASQPHLDGGFTCFGRVISGMQVVERLVPGDRIKKVTIQEDTTLLDYRRY